MLATKVKAVTGVSMSKWEGSAIPAAKGGETETNEEICVGEDRRGETRQY